MNKKSSKKSGRFTARGIIFLLASLGGVAFASAAIISGNQDKIDNDPQSAKQALDSLHFSDAPGNPVTAAHTDDMKIAALDGQAIKASLAPPEVELQGAFAQGGLVRGKTEPGASVKLDDIDVMVDPEGWFILGFHRDHPESAMLVVTSKDGRQYQQVLNIEDREFNIERIDGLPDNKVSTYTEEELAKIGRDKEKKTAARMKTTPNALWRDGFSWPLTGRISGQFGSQRILNGVPKRMHSGVDIAAPTGTPVHAPADGVVTLAESDMYFEGGLVFIDHGQWVETIFMHMSEVKVKTGDHVSKGQVIGAVGATGRATGPHLHWSMKWKNRLVDAKLAAGPMPVSE